jgi:L-asparaginase II
VLDPSGVTLAVAERSGFVENIHRGTAVILDSDGAILRAWGDADRIIYPRSSNKPMQATGMLHLGLPLRDELLALTTASHSGAPQHLDGVRRVLDQVELDELALRTPPDLPLGEPERHAWIRAGLEPTPIAMNCSGKHAAMLMTCRLRDWPMDTYTQADHPLQGALAQTLSELAGERIAHTGVDGCGAPLFAISIAGMARALQAVIRDSDGALLVDAMRTYPVMVGGAGRDVTEVMRSVPGCVAKDGADGVWVAALDDGRALAVKIDDGDPVARIVVVLGLLDSLGIRSTMDVGRVLGGGKTVGRVRALI